MGIIRLFIGTAICASLIACGGGGGSSSGSSSSGSTDTTSFLGITSEGNKSPLFFMTATSDTNIIVNNTVSFTLEASDPDGSIAKIECDFDGDSKYETDETGHIFISPVITRTGTFNITCRATDNEGATTTSEPIELTVEPDSYPSISFSFWGSSPSASTSDSEGCTVSAGSNVSFCIYAGDDVMLSKLECDLSGDGVFDDYVITSDINWEASDWLATYPQHQFSSTGTFNTQCRITDSAGQTTYSNIFTVTAN